MWEFSLDYLLTTLARKLLENGRQFIVKIGYLMVALILTRPGRTRQSLKMVRKMHIIASSCSVLRHMQLFGVIFLSTQLKYVNPPTPCP
jgi:hypothetical protein